MSDPLNGLKPTQGSVEVNPALRGIGEFLIEDDRTVDVASFYGDAAEADSALFADAHAAHIATGLAPSQLAQALADEKALTAELRSQRDELVKASARALEMISFADLCVGDCQPGIDNHKAGCGELAIRTALARVKGGTR